MAGAELNGGRVVALVRWRSGALPAWLALVLCALCCGSAVRVALCGAVALWLAGAERAAAVALCRPGCGRGAIGGGRRVRSWSGAGWSGRALRGVWPAERVALQAGAQLVGRPPYCCKTVGGRKHMFPSYFSHGYTHIHILR